MECFQVAAGIQISYNNLNTDPCFQPLKFERDFFQIDHTWALVSRASAMLCTSCTAAVS